MAEVSLTMNSAHLAFTLLDEIVDVLFSDAPT